MIERCQIINLKNKYERPKSNQLTKELYNYLLNKEINNFNYWKNNINKKKTESLNSIYIILLYIIKKYNINNNDKLILIKLIDFIILYKSLLKRNYSLNIIYIINVIKKNVTKIKFNFFLQNKRLKNL